MILRSSFFKLLKEDMKRRIWCISLFSIILFLSMPVLTALRLQNTSSGQIPVMLSYSLGPENSYLLALVVIFSVVCGLSSFFYLHSRKKVDLYHSLPMKRELIFGVNFINGLLIFFIPYFINLVLSAAVGMMHNAITSSIIGVMAWGLLVHTLYYCMLYTVTIIAVMLTGNIITSFLGTMVFFSYGYILLGVKDSYFTTFFTTYYNGNGYNTQAVISYLSPVGCYYRLVSLFRMEEPLAITLAVHFGIVMMLIGIALLLFKKRASEAAGKSMSFELSKPIIKFLLVIPLSLGGGIVLRNAVNDNTSGWLIFGIILSLIIMNGIIQVIFNFDIRAALHNKRQLALCAIITVSIVGIFKYDMFGYDSYMPKLSDIKSMGLFVNINNNDYNNMFYYDDELNYVDPVRYHLKRPLQKDMNVAYELTKFAIDNQETTQNHVASTKSLKVRYNLKNGRTVYRRYYYRGEDVPLREELFDSQEFKKSHYPILEWKLREIQSIMVYPNTQMGDESSIVTTLELKDDKLNEFLSIYKEELSKLTYEEAIIDKTMASLDISIHDRGGNMFYVYPSFVKSLAYIKERGLDIGN